MKQVFLKILLNSLLGLALVFIWSRFINLGDVFSKLFTVSPTIILPFLIFFLLSGGLKALRLQKILKIPGLSLKDLCFLNFLSQFLSFMIPLRAGEISKSVYLSSQFRVPFGKTLTWIFIDRFLDFLAFIAIVAIFINFVPTNLPLDFFKILITTLIFFLLFLIVAIKKSHLLKRTMEFLSIIFIFSRLKKKFLEFSFTIIEGFEILDRHSKDLFLFLLLSFSAAFSDGLILLVVFRQFLPDFTVIQGLLGNALVAFTFLIPSAPGFVGSAEAAGLAVFSGILGVNSDVASSATVLNHLLTLIVLAVLGITSLYFLKFDLSLVWKKLRKE